jgi:RNA polymerase sigma factor (sigma-70 family)
VTREEFEKEVEQLYYRADGRPGIAPRLLRFARKHGARDNDEAEELVQETLSTLDPATFHGESSFGTWVRKALRNKLRDRIELNQRRRRERKVALAFLASDIAPRNISSLTEGVSLDEEPTIPWLEVEPEAAEAVVPVRGGGQFRERRDAHDEEDLAPVAPLEPEAEDDEKLQRTFRGLRHVLPDPSDAPLELPPDEFAEAGEAHARTETRARYLLTMIPDPKIRRAVERIYREDTPLDEVAAELGYDPTRLGAAIEREFARLRTLQERQRTELKRVAVEGQPTLGMVIAAAPATTIRAIVFDELRKFQGAFGRLDIRVCLAPVFAAALPLIQALVRGPKGEGLDEQQAWRVLVPQEPALIFANGLLRLEDIPATVPALDEVPEKLAQAWAADLRKLVCQGLREAGARRGRGRPEVHKDVPPFFEVERELVEEYYVLREKLDLFQQQASEGRDQFAARVAWEIKGLERIGREIGERYRRTWPSSWSRLTEETIRSVVPQHINASGRLMIKPLAESLLALAYGASSPKAIENRIVRFEREFAR